MPRVVRDRKGRHYDFSIVESESLLVFQLHHQQLLVGEAKCRRTSPTTLWLQDIVIANEAIPKPRYGCIRKSLNPIHINQFEDLLSTSANFI